MKLTKKFLTVLLASLMLVGCGSSTKETSKTEITFWTYPVGNFAKAEDVDKLLEAFYAKNPDITVTVEYLDYTNGDDQVNTAIEGNAAPNVIFEGPERLVANWGAKGLMLDLADLWTSEVKSEIYESVEKACKDNNGTYYEFPLCMTAHTMAINKEMFEKANALQYVDLETRTWTTENFVKAVEALVASGQDKVGAVFCGGQGGDQGTRALINNLYSGTFTSADHSSYNTNSEENVKALELLYNLDGINFDAGIVGGDEIQLFCNKTLAMAFCWNSAQEVSNADKIDFDVIPMNFPTDDGKVELAGGIWGFGIFKNQDQAKVEASKKFVEFLANDKDQVKDTVKTSTYWAVRDLGNIYEGDELKTEYSQFVNNLGDYYQVTAGWAQARTAWWNMLQEVGKGENVKNALDKFASEANKAAQQ